MHTARTPLAVLVAAVATVGLAAPKAVAERGDAPGTNAEAGPGNRTLPVVGWRGGREAASSVFGTTPVRPADGSGRTAWGIGAIHPGARAEAHGVTVRRDGGRTLAVPVVLTAVGSVQGGVGGATKADVAIGGGLLGTGALAGTVFWIRRHFGKRA
ncbi:hypothetical protein [Streptomyces carpinensis]|uniref:Integral membrane protein n=1 Tax=Streptomyces carpinensis TaxID=66369 RepID=A0ABV1VXA0_9ACTN|nr:hypothetical protein [Streptomyces carpinensis]